MTAIDLTTATRVERDRHSTRTEVLDKVGVLRQLPDDLHCTTPMVAEFYGVGVDVIRQAVVRNREELDDDGYAVLRLPEVSDMLSLTPSELGLPNGTAHVALFPRRAVLRIGMLLRDSPIARKVRDYLLEAERGWRIPTSFSDALRLAADEHDARELAEAKVVELSTKITDDEPLVLAAKEFFNEEGSLTYRESARALGVKDRTFNSHLRDWGWVDLTGTGARAYAVERGYAVNRVYTTRFGTRVVEGRLTRKGVERAARKLTPPPSTLQPSP